MAPRLIDAPITPDQAGGLYRDLRRQIIGMLCCDLIHGDLSPYNVLLAAAGPTLIDFPQTISAAHNSQSERFFQRDLDNILRFLASFDRRLNAHRGDGREIWRAYTLRELSPDFTPAAREDRPPPRPPLGPGQQAPRPHHGQQARWDRGPQQGPEGQRPQRGPGARSEAQQQPSQAPQQRGPGQGQGQQPPQLRAPGYRQAPPRSAPRDTAPQGGRGPVVVYVKRSGTRESGGNHDGGTAPATSQTSAQEQQGHSREGRRDRGRR